MAVNPWFNVFNGALSDMGRAGLGTAYVFNTGLIITSFVGMGYAYCLANVFRRKFGVFSAGVYLVAAFFLLLIAAFPEGTDPHQVVSYAFFLLMDTVMMLYGLALWLEGLKTRGVLSALLSLMALSGSIIIDWPSVAIMELYNVFIYAAWYVLMLSATRSLLRLWVKNEL